MHQALKLRSKLDIHLRRQPMEQRRRLQHGEHASAPSRHEHLCPQALPIRTES
eukprot:NODE_6217_length_645_cov_5.709732_g5288_i0.p5 GENE.NODE_6217_length_645_cov_5.709732_g5288_i0~~NODE_6217_length_645_cov_5.709732_g5288_i0.p5  ORF type:complete len:53 (-),score=3.68 NODE_6217_length_645_cov_5.709732_g5288_i0:67-225(-)